MFPDEYECWSILLANVVQPNAIFRTKSWVEEEFVRLGTRKSMLD